MRLTMDASQIAHMAGGVLVDEDRTDERLFEIEVHFHNESDCDEGLLFVTLEVIESRQHVLVGGLVSFRSDGPLAAASDEDIIRELLNAGLHRVAYDTCALVARQMASTLGFAIVVDASTPDADITVDRVPAESPDESI